MIISDIPSCQKKMSLSDIFHRILRYKIRFNTGKQQFCAHKNKHNV